MHEARVVLHQRDNIDYRFAWPQWRQSLERVPVEDVLAQVKDVDAARCRRLTVSGCPLEHPDLFTILERLRAQGFRHFALETDAAMLAQAGKVARLTDLGVEHFFLVVGGIREKVYEHVMQDPGTFRPAMAGVREALRGVARVYVVAPLVRWNVEDLEPLVEWLLALDGKLHGFLLALPEIGRVPLPAHKLVLTYAKEAEVAERVFRSCQGRRLEYGFFSKRGILPCAAGGHLERYASVFWERVQFMRHAKDEDLVRVPACEACSLNQTCKGAERRYVEAFGTGEMQAVPFEASGNWKLRKHNSLEQRDFTHVSEFKNDVTANPMALVRVNGHCNMSCSFCFIDRTVPDFDPTDLLSEIRTLYASGARHLVLSGGEPTIHPDLPQLVRASKEMGYTIVELHSNGVRAAEFAYAEELKAAGVDQVTVSLHSQNPEKSDEITRLPRAFGKTIQAMHHFRKLGVEPKFAHVITQFNFRELPELVKFLHDEFPPEKAYYSICFAIAQPISDLVFSWVIPTFTEVRPFFKQALDDCLDHGIGFGGMLGQGGYPPCMLDGEMKYYDMNLGQIYTDEGSDAAFYKAPRCVECSFHDHCLGVRKDYVEFYGDHEIKPFRAEIVMPEKRVQDPMLVTKGRALVQIGATVKAER